MPAGADGQCLTEVNAARGAAGFGELKQAVEEEKEARLPDESASAEQGEYENWAWKPVCDALAKKFESGTYAYMPVEDAANVNCTAVVDTWKAAYSNFSGLPPPHLGNEKLYKNHDNVSFVAMYNPSADATADCRVVTCTKKTTAGGEKGGEGFLPRAEDAGETIGSALICMTVPDVLPAEGSTAPFSEDQWGQIVTAFEGSASAVSPCVISLAAAIFGLLML
ncbi:SAG family member [Eimeria brunetti]|uniref:SAG family member n=1 Tax=Eimeria brunetti TaxID=51314 RepID=U6LD18_9EIME|nr:SAG family member [Eimeria brunetti]